MNGEKNAADQALDLLFRRGFERLGVGTEPGVENTAATYPQIDTADDRFHLR